MALRVEILGVGLVGPGLSDWPAAAPLLREPSRRTPIPTELPPPNRLPPTERRRAGPMVKAAIVVADQAVAACGLDAAELPTVFASSSGESSNCHALCEALAAPERLVSPTRFTNSVHNAAAGYWHIAARATAPSTSLSAHDASFAAGLFEAAVQCVAGARPVLLVACDVPYPEPLHSKRPLSGTFGVAFVLAPAVRGGAPRMEIEFAGDAPATRCDDAALEALRRTIPAARSLPLLEALARGASGRIVVEGPGGMSLQVDLG
jgi:Beta-ketoacyl synthase, N-terminal domain